MASVCGSSDVIENFFVRYCGATPVQNPSGKNTIYSVEGEDQISLMVDSYGGCHIDIGQAFKFEEQYINQKMIPRSNLQDAIKNLGLELKQTKLCDSLWVNFNLPMSIVAMGSILPESFVIGSAGTSDLIYDYQTNKVRVWNWLNEEKECAIPLGATHNIGATALICDMEARKLLLVVNQRRNKDWNLPGGGFDRLRDKTPADTAFHEAAEEGGIELDRSKVTDTRLIGQMQFPKNQFASAINQIWLFVMNGVSQMELNPPAQEIKIAAWIDFDQILQAEGKLHGFGLSQEIQGSLLAAIHSLGAKEVENKGWKVTHLPVPNSQ